MRTFSSVRGRHAATVVLALSWAAPVALRAQEPYLTPPRIVVDALDAPPLPLVSLNPDRTMLLLADRAAMPTIAELSQPMLRLAGERINPRTNGPHRQVHYTALRITQVADGTVRPLAAPAGAKLGYPAWSPDGRQIAFTVTGDSDIALWVASALTGAATPLAHHLNAALGAPCSWMPDGAELLCRFVPQGRGAPPAVEPAPAGPNVHVADGHAAPVRTYEDLLQNPYDERRFDFYATAALARVDARSGGITTLGSPGLFNGADPSPDGRFILVERLVKPYSYLVTDDLFPQVVEVWDRDGHMVRQIAELPLADRIPIRGVRAGPRAVGWRPGRPATLVWAEALDGGDPRRAVPQRDRVLALTLPATGEPVELARVDFRFAGLAWSEAGGMALLSENDRASRRLRTWIINPDSAAVPRRLLFDRNSEDRYGDPGRPAMRRTASGELVMLQSPDRRYLYLMGDGASAEGDRPFLDRLDLRTLRTERLFRSAGESYESVVALLDPGAARVLTSRESPAEPPNYFVRDIRSGAERPLTQFRDPAPQLTGITHRLVRYQRADGVQLSGTLYLPAGYAAGTRLPLILWVYPSEFATADAAGQVRGSPYRFTRISGPSHLFLLTQGYAVLDNPSLPVVGGDTANNSYVRQVVMGAQAAIDYLVGQGIADRARVGVGGHSYGAFTTANLLAHSDLFRTGIARSGAYNRTLTPFGFQNEERTYWQARDVYTAMSPFTYADSINEPILLIHGEADDNSGTFPIQSDRFYAALKGLGATATLVTYPAEAHGYAARETILDCVARMISWFDRYVKPETAPAPLRAETH